MSRSSQINTDIAIVGGGVAGSALAGALARAGHGVVLLEREPRFRDRVRGEGMHPWGARAADALDVLPVFRAAGALELMRWQIYSDRAPVTSFRWDDNAPGWPGEWTIYHPTLQQALLDHAVAGGATLLRPARVTGFRRTPSPEITLSTEQGEQHIRARLVVGADGRQSGARQWLGATTHHDPTHHQIGGMLLAGLNVPPDAAHMAFVPGAYSLIYPQHNDRARVYFITLAEGAEHLRGHGHEDAYTQTVAALFPDGRFGSPQPAGPLAFFPGADIWPDRLAGDGVVLLGDAAGANDPSMGHGLSLAFRDALELRNQLLSTHDWDVAIQDYATVRSTYYAVLRAHTAWQTHLWLDVGPDADARRARANRAAELDPPLMGFGSLIARGPDGVTLSEEARAHFFGEDLPSA